MKTKLSVSMLSVFLSLLLLSSCHTDAVQGEESSTPTIPTAVLEECEDLGQAYIDSFVFFGESTTYHLKSRGVLSGGTETTQVWGPPGGTVNLDTTVGTLKIVYPESGELLTFGEAVRRKKPERILLCFGLNGAVGNVRKGKDYYKSCYEILIQAVRQNSPDTEIYLQSAFPVAENMDMQYHSVSLDTLNGYIDTINSWSAELALEHGIGYLNSAEVLKDENGRLRTEYQVGDGYHLTAQAYDKILYYIRTHGKKGENV